MKLDYTQAFTLGFGLFADLSVWMIYNICMPIFLPTGNPDSGTRLAVSALGKARMQRSDPIRKTA